MTSPEERGDGGALLSLGLGFGLGGGKGVGGGVGLGLVGPHDITPAAHRVPTSAGRAKVMFDLFGSGLGLGLGSGLGLGLGLGLGHQGCNRRFTTS